MPVAASWTDASKRRRTKNRCCHNKKPSERAPSLFGLIEIMSGQQQHEYQQHEEVIGILLLLGSLICLGTWPALRTLRYLFLRVVFICCCCCLLFAAAAAAAAAAFYEAIVKMSTTTIYNIFRNNTEGSLSLTQACSFIFHYFIFLR